MEEDFKPKEAITYKTELNLEQEGLYQSNSTKSDWLQPGELLLRAIMHCF